MKRCLTTDEEIFINQFSQNLHSLEDINNWFFSYDLENKRDIISNLLNIVIQSHPTYDDIESAAISLNKSRSVSAVKLLNRKKPFDKFGYELCDLPEKELLTCFDILMLTLVRSDTRRKEQELPETCSHWWHKDLSDQDYLRQLRKNGLK